MGDEQSFMDVVLALLSFSIDTAAKQTTFQNGWQLLCWLLKLF
jgi:hypothetical protein